MIITFKIKSLTSKVNFAQNLRFLTTLFSVHNRPAPQKQSFVDVEKDHVISEHDIDQEPRGNEWDAW